MGTSLRGKEEHVAKPGSEELHIMCARERAQVCAYARASVHDGLCAQARQPPT